jgi:hypothetical protein
LKHAQAQIFYDYLDHCFYALDDSTFIWKFDSKRNQWEKAPIILDLEIPFEEFLKDFIALSDKNCPTYFVYRGCGIVYKKDGMRISRHDKSFKHENQFDGSFFMFEGVPHVYGGYGMFTAKNIITRYDTTIGEWYAVDAKGEFPPAGCWNILIEDQSNLILFEGYKLHNNKYWNRINGIYQFNKKNSSWKRIGLFNHELKGNRNDSPFANQVLNNNALFCYGNYIVSYNVRTKSYIKYKLDSNFLYRKALRNKNLVLFFKETISPSYIVEVMDISFLQKCEMKKGSLVFIPKFDLMNWLKLNWYIPLLVFFFMYFIFKILKIKFSNKNKNARIKIQPIQLSKLEILNLSEHENRLMELFLNAHSGLEISAINDLVNYDDPTIDTLKKRREILLKDLRIKLSIHYNIPVSQIFIEHRMETDKRMKLIFLNPEIAKSL